MTKPNDLPLTREQISKYLQGRRGANRRLSEACNVTSVTVTLVLQGRSESARVWEAAEKLARELMAEDERILGTGA